MSTVRNNHSLTPLTNGRILVAGGESGGWGVCNTLSTAQRYDPVTGKWLIAASMNVARSLHTATPLRDGKVLVVGGVAREPDCYISPALRSAELYNYPRPATAP
ncbi:kelch repeat-containing protein [Defluviicoccus vanus]|uniref:Galactose oxidase n=1 Tax=Defluviicoccus vanus TaxID=111831 RepID=A0A7H1N412_9PROT|nr:hypothetical protein HQ394_15320 [Defluviicoccus vanus]